MSIGEKGLTGNRGPEVVREVGWRFSAIGPSGHGEEIFPTTTGQISYDDNNSSRYTLTGLVFLPNSMYRFNPNTDYIVAFMSVEGVTYQMGKFYATSLSRQKDVILDPDADDEDGDPIVADLVHIDFADGFVKLQQSTESPIVALKGADPSDIMRDAAEFAGFSTSVAASITRMGSDTTWSAFTSLYEVINSVYPIAGHRAPWISFAGIFCSVAARQVAEDAIPLESLDPIAGTVTISETFLSAPNRVVVFDDQAPYPLVGVWNAPASAPHSFANRGYYVTQPEPQQGLPSIQAAVETAATIGEQLTARTLNASIFPTPRLDGPKILSYDGALWLIRSWSMSTAPGSVIDLEATELIEND